MTDGEISQSGNEISGAAMTVAVIGLGYVGLPLCEIMHNAGHYVIGLDNDTAKIASLSGGCNYLKHLGNAMVANLLHTGRFEPTSDIEELSRADAILICVPTPLNANNEPDLSFVCKTAMDLVPILRLYSEKNSGNRKQIIVLESTTYPGTTREVIKPILDKAGVEYYLAFSPERIDPGRIDPPVSEITKLVGGVDSESTQAVYSLYTSAFSKVVAVSSSEVAEAAKLMENIYRAVNIALANEMKIVLDHMGINVWEVIEAAATKPFGYQAFYPGPGLGGHCIPIDPFYMAWKANQSGTKAEFIELAGRVNRAMPQRVVKITLDALSDTVKVCNGEQALRILVLGLAYKPNIDDVRESPSFELMRLFGEAGCDVDYSDPHVTETHEMRHYGNLGMTSIPLSAQKVAEYDALVIATAHDGFDWGLIAKHARLIVDTRNVMRGYPVGSKLINA